MKLINETYTDIGKLMISYESISILAQDLVNNTVFVQNSTKTYSEIVFIPSIINIIDEPLYTTVTYNAS